MKFSGPSRIAVLAVALWVHGCGLREHPHVARGKADAGKSDARGRADARAPEPGIDINGTVVPRDRAIVFIHFGHSNMAGLAQSPEALRSYFFDPAPQLWSYQGDGRFEPAREPTAP